MDQQLNVWVEAFFKTILDISRTARTGGKQTGIGRKLKGGTEAALPGAWSLQCFVHNTHQGVTKDNPQSLGGEGVGIDSTWNLEPVGRKKTITS